MKVKLVAFGIAREIIGGKELVVDVPDGTTIHRLKEILVTQYPTFSTLRSLSFAVSDEYRDDDFVLNNESEVVLIPPVAGG